MLTGDLVNDSELANTSQNMIVAVTKAASIPWEQITFDKLIYFTVTYVLPPCGEAAFFTSPRWGTDNSNTLDVSYMIGD